MANVIIALFREAIAARADKHVARVEKAATDAGMKADGNSFSIVTDWQAYLDHILASVPPRMPDLLICDHNMLGTMADLASRMDEYDHLESVPTIAVIADRPLNNVRANFPNCRIIATLDPKELTKPESLKRLLTALSNAGQGSREVNTATFEAGLKKAVADEPKDLPRPGPTRRRRGPIKSME